MPDITVSSLDSRVVIELTTKVRLRHPKGVTTLNFDPSQTTVDDLKGLIFASTEIIPNEQDSMFFCQHLQYKYDRGS
jgi:hypothetical protein